MKWLVKILAVVLVLCILLTLFVACKKKGADTEEEEEQSGQGKSRSDVVSSIPDDEDLEPEDHNITDDTADAGQLGGN